MHVPHGGTHAELGEMVQGRNGVFSVSKTQTSPTQYTQHNAANQWMTDTWRTRTRDVLYLHSLCSSSLPHSQVRSADDASIFELPGGGHLAAHPPDLHLRQPHVHHFAGAIRVANERNLSMRSFRGRARIQAGQPNGQHDHRR